MLIFFKKIAFKFPFIVPFVYFVAKNTKIPSLLLRAPLYNKQSKRAGVPQRTFLLLTFCDYFNFLIILLSISNGMTVAARIITFSSSRKVRGTHLNTLPPKYIINI